MYPFNIVSDMECDPGKTVCGLFRMDSLGNVLTKKLFSNEHPMDSGPNPLLSFFRYTIPRFLSVA